MVTVRVLRIGDCNARILPFTRIGRVIQCSIEKVTDPPNHVYATTGNQDIGQAG